MVQLSVGTSPERVRGAQNSHYWRALRCRDVHGPAVTGQKQLAFIQQRGQFGERSRTQVASAAPVPDSSGLKNFIASIFGVNSAANPREQDVQDDDDVPPQPQQRQKPPARVQVASAAPQPILPEVARQQQKQRERLQWQVGPAPANEQQNTDDATGSTTLAYANAAERNLPLHAPARHGTLTPEPLVAGAHQLSAGFARADGLNEFKHPQQTKGFAAPVRAMVENRFQEFAPTQLSPGFQRDRAPVVVVGFEANRAASR